MAPRKSEISRVLPLKRDSSLEGVEHSRRLQGPTELKPTRQQQGQERRFGYFFPHGHSTLQAPRPAWGTDSLKFEWFNPKPVVLWF